MAIMTAKQWTTGTVLFTIRARLQVIQDQVLQRWTYPEAPDIYM